MKGPLSLYGKQMAAKQDNTSIAYRAGNDAREGCGQTLQRDRERLKIYSGVTKQWKPLYGLQNMLCEHHSSSANYNIKPKAGCLQQPIHLMTYKAGLEEEGAAGLIPVVRPA